VNSYTTYSQSLPAVASDGTGGFVVVWNSSDQDGSDFGIFGQRYASMGEPLGEEFRVNSYTTRAQAAPSVARDTSGSFVVAWQSLGQDGADLGIYAQRFSSAGSPVGSEFRVNSYTTDFQELPSVATDGSGRFVVTWQSYGPDDFGFGIFGQRYQSSGAPAGAEFRVNTHTPAYQTLPAVAASPSGFVVVWKSDGQDGSSSGIYAQRFTAACPHGDANGDLKIDVQDVFYLINALFAGGTAPVCSGDVNGDQQFAVGDVFYLINFLFAGGPAPV